MRCRSCGGLVQEGASECRGCGSGDIERNRPLAVGCASRMMAWTVVATSLHLLFAEGWFVRYGGLAFAYAFGASPWYVAERVLAFCVVTWLCAVLVQSVVGKEVPVLRSYGRAAVWTAAALARATTTLAKLAWVAVEGPRKEKPKRDGTDGNGR